MDKANLKTVRDSLAVAWASLAAGRDPRTAPLGRRLQDLEHRLDTARSDWLDAASACDRLRSIIGELEQLQETRPGTAVGANALMPRDEPELLPGVVDAIRNANKALSLLLLDV